MFPKLNNMLEIYFSFFLFSVEAQQLHVDLTGPLGKGQ